MAKKVIQRAIRVAHESVVLIYLGGNCIKKNGQPIPTSSEGLALTHVAKVEDVQDEYCRGRGSGIHGPAKD